MTVLIGAYTLALVAVVVACRLFGERSWFITLLLYSPRYAWLGPILPLAVASVGMRSARCCLVLVMDAAFVFFVLMGFNIPAKRPGTTHAEGTAIRILTLNRGSGQIDIAGLNRLIAEERIDVVCFQEGEPPGFVSRAAPGYHWNLDHRIASRFPILNEDRPEIPRCEGETDLFVRMPILTLRVSDDEQLRLALIDMPSMTRPLKRLGKGRLEAEQFRSQTQCRRAYARSIMALVAERPSPLIIAGDFNGPPDSDTLAPFDARLTDSFSEAGFGLGYTWPVKYRFLRLDRIMRTAGCRFSRAEVGPSVGSDHLPYWAEVVLQRRHSTRSPLIDNNP